MVNCWIASRVSPRRPISWPSFCPPLLNRSAAYTLPESIGSGIGAGLAFILAATLICKGLHIISQNQDMPKAFRGTPAAFVYVALLSLAFSGFSGSSLFS